MTTVIADLQARLGLDLSGFRQGIEQAHQEGKRLSDALEQSASSVKILKDQLDQTRTAMVKMIAEGVSPTDAKFQQLQEVFAKQQAALTSIKGGFRETQNAANTLASGPLSTIRDTFTDIGTEGAALAGRLAPLITSLGAVGIALGALALVSIKSVQALTELSLRVRDLAYLSGGTPNQISGLIDVVNDLGVASETVQLSMNRMSQAVATGDSALARIGVSTRNAAGQIKSGLALFYDTIDALHNMTDSIERNRAAQEIFGRGWTQMVPIIERGSAALREAAAASSLLISQEDIDRSRQYREAVEELKDQIESIKLSVGRELILPITVVIQWAGSAAGIFGRLAGDQEAAKRAIKAQAEKDLKALLGSGLDVDIARTLQIQAEQWKTVPWAPTPSPAAETLPEVEARLKYQSETLRLRSQLTTVTGSATTEEARYSEQLRVTDANLQVVLQTLKTQETIEKELINLRYRKGEFGPTATPESIAAGTLTPQQQQALKRQTDLMTATTTAINQQRVNAVTTSNARTTELNEAQWKYLNDRQLTVERETYREVENMDGKELVRKAKYQTDISKVIIDSETAEQNIRLQNIREFLEKKKAAEEQYGYLEPTGLGFGPAVPRDVIDAQRRVQQTQEEIRRATEAVQLGGARFMPIVDYRDQVRQIQAMGSLLRTDQFDALQAELNATQSAMQAMIAQMDNATAAERERLAPALDDLRARFETLQQAMDRRAEFRAIFSGISAGITTSINGVIQGTQKLSDAFRNMVQNISLSITNVLIDGALKDLERALESLAFPGQSTGKPQSLVGRGFSGLWEWATGLFGGGSAAATTGAAVGFQDLLTTMGPLGAMQEGGIITKPTMTLLGEAGPEVVLNQKQLASLSPDAQRAIFTVLRSSTGLVSVSSNREESERIESRREEIERNRLTSVLKFADGGIVRQPTLAMIGEAGPEVVLNRRQLDVLPMETRRIILDMVRSPSGFLDLWGGRTRPEVNQTSNLSVSQITDNRSSRITGDNVRADSATENLSAFTSEVVLNQRQVNVLPMAAQRAIFQVLRSSERILDTRGGTTQAGQFNRLSLSPLTQFFTMNRNVASMVSDNRSSAESLILKNAGNLTTFHGGSPSTSFGGSSSTSIGGTISNVLPPVAAPSFRGGGISSMIASVLPSVPKLAAGGIVTRPTLSLLGEAGPEAIIPLRETSREGVPMLVQNINVSPGVSEAVRREINILRPRLRKDAVDALIEARNRGGAVARALGERGK